MKMHHKKKEKKQGFREKLHGLKNLSDKQYKKWQEKLFRERTEREKIPHSYEEIAETVNNLKTTWKAKAYKKDYTPFLGAILDGLEGLPEKKNSKNQMLIFQMNMIQELLIQNVNLLEKLEINLLVVHAGLSVLLKL
jgi:endonuclease IV